MVHEKRGRIGGRKWFYGLQSFLIVSALVIDLDVREGAGRLDELLGALKHPDLISLILFLLFLHLLYVSEKRKENRPDGRMKKLCICLPAAFFAFSMVFGYSFYKCNSWELVFGSSVQFVKSCIAFAGYYCLFHAGIVLLYDQADHALFRGDTNKQKGIVGYYMEYLETYPFRTAFLTCLLAFLPYMILSYPGIFTCDTKIQIDNGYGALVHGSVHLRNQHPVIHTILLVAATFLGQNLFGSANGGIFFLSLLQFLLTAGAVAWTIRYLVQCRVSPKVLMVVLAFFVLNPRIQNYLFLQVKDVWYAPFLMLFVVEFHRALTGRYEEGQGKRKYVPLLISITGTFFFRQDGIYVLFLTLLAAGILVKEKRRLFLSLLVGVFLFSLIYQRGILPACQVKDNNTRQLFSIPFQQTARYLRDAGEDVTLEEAEAIAAVLDYEHLGELYNPNLSDPVKSTFNKEATLKDIAVYLKAWGGMFFRHPDIYVQATMNNLYGYFYPSGYTTEIQDYGTSLEYMEESNDHQGLNLGYPKALSGLRERMEYVREMLFQMPVLSVLNLAASYIWALLLLLFYGIYRNNRTLLLILVPLLVVFLICMAGPTYGWYFRYMYSIVMCLPGVVCLGLLSD